MSNLKLIAYAGVGLVIFLSGWTINGWRWEAEHTAYKVKIKKAQDKIAKERKEAIDEADSLYNELEDKRNENSRLRADVASGRARLRINATCTTSGEGGSTGVDQTASPRLTPDAEQAYFDLRDGIIFQRKQLEACQSLL